MRRINNDALLVLGGLVLLLALALGLILGAKVESGIKKRLAENRAESVEVIK